MTSCARSAPNELPVELVVNKIDAVDTLGRRRLANRYPDALQISALTGEGLDELRARIAERFGERFERVRLLLPYEEGGRLNELYALGAPIDEREDTPEGVLVRRPPAAPRAAPLRAVPDRRGSTETPPEGCMTELARDAPPRGGDAAYEGVRGRRGPGSLRERESRARTGERALVGTGLAVAIPDGHAGFVQPRSGLAARHGIAVLNSPGLVDAGYRGELKVVLLNTDRNERFVVEPGMRIAQLVVVPVVLPEPREVTELPVSDRGERGFGSSAH